MLATQITDALNAGAYFVTGSSLAIMQGTPTDARPTENEYEKVTDATTNILARFAWVTKVRMVSDAGTLIGALGVWGMRVYVIWGMGHPEKIPPRLRGFFGFADDTPPPHQPPQEQAQENGKPAPIDYGILGFGEVRDQESSP